MKMIFGFIGIQIAAQVLLFGCFWFFRPVFISAYEMYQFSPGLLYFYAFGIGVSGWLAVSVLRIHVLQSGLGSRSNRHGRTKGHG